MTQSLSIIQSTPVCGLATQTYTVPTTGLYTVAVNYTIPYIASGSSADSTVTTGGSALQLLLKLNGSTKLTLGSPTPTQPVLAGSVVMSCTAGDSITVVPSSANAVDAGLNAVKGIINIYQGE